MHAYAKRADFSRNSAGTFWRNEKGWQSRSGARFRRRKDRCAKAGRWQSQAVSRKGTPSAWTSRAREITSTDAGAKRRLRRQDGRGSAVSHIHGRQSPPGAPLRHRRHSILRLLYARPSQSRRAEPARGRENSYNPGPIPQARATETSSPSSKVSRGAIQAEPGRGARQKSCAYLQGRHPAPRRTSCGAYPSRSRNENTPCVSAREGLPAPRPHECAGCPTSNPASRCG